MQCTMCGREITNPNANFCDYCGTALGTNVYREENVQTSRTAPPKEDRVSTWVFLGIMCLPMIPFVGTIAYLVFLFYWAFAPDIEDSRKSFARAMLIYTAISLAFVVIIFGTVFAGLMSSISSVL